MNTQKLLFFNSVGYHLQLHIIKTKLLDFPRPLLLTNLKFGKGCAYQQLDETCVKLSDSRDLAKKNKTKQNKRRPNVKQGVPHDLGKGATPALFAVLRTIFASVFTVSTHNNREPGTSYVRLYARDGGGGGAKTFKPVWKAG